MDLRKNKVAMFLKDMCKTSCDKYIHRGMKFAVLTALVSTTYCMI